MSWVVIRPDRALIPVIRVEVGSRGEGAANGSETGRRLLSVREAGDGLPGFLPWEKAGLFSQLQKVSHWPRWRSI